MKLRFCESEIDYWANRYTECQSASGRERENQVIGFRGKIQGQGSLTQYHLYKVIDWVLSVYGVDAVGSASRNNETHIELTTRQAFTVTDDWEKLMTLTALSGIRQTTASAILHLYDKEQYPILSGRALWSVEEPKRDYYPDWLWLKYIEFCRDIVKRNEIEMRTLDRALWFYSYDSREC
ncbi:hypothetical protein F4Z98_04250 [Candidatus Poribacteria bacterium]|nr:hypothetical protein [Candidatus Poribacteria bacterium]MYC39526.1 hypothetical protein [Candidatus Dadabacteria bacterium]